VTTNSGVGGGGQVFEVTPTGRSQTLYYFNDVSPGSAAGEFPGGPLLETPDGSLYGTTLEGGAENFGALFKLTHVFP